MQRPTGVTLAAIALGIDAAFQAIMACLMTVVAVLTAKGALPSTPGQPTPSPGAMTAIFLVSILFFLALTAWGATTVVGLFRMRTWARYSILIIGGLTAGLGILSAAVTLLAATLAKNFIPPPAPDQPAPPPHLFLAVFIGIALFYLAIAAIGIWWLVYFNLRSTRTAFQQPLIEGELFTPPARPVAITVIAALFFFGSFCCFLYTFTPLPAFMLGFIATGTPARLTYLLIALLEAAIGIGLLRLQNIARLATIALLAFGSINFLLLALPSYRHKAVHYLDQVSTQMGTSTTDATRHFQLILVLGSLAFSIVIYAVVFWLLQRHRDAFYPASAAAPLSTDSLSTL